MRSRISSHFLFVFSTQWEEGYVVLQMTTDVLVLVNFYRDLTENCKVWIVGFEVRFVV